MSKPPTVGGYSFYLNVVVINSGVARDEFVSSSGEMPLDASRNEILDDPGERMPEPTPEEGAVIDVSSPESKNRKLLVEGRALVDSFSHALTKRAAAFVVEEKKRNTPDAKKLVQDGQKLMSSIGHSITKQSSSISRKATAFVKNSTMISRTQKAVVDCIPLVTEEIGVEMSISKRFQQGPIFVLEVDMKGCDLLDLLEKVLGEEPAQHYRHVRRGLDYLDMPESRETFDKEILPKVRKGLMETMSAIVPEKMKMQKGNDDLEIQCVALEDAEEAKWLYNFLEFMEQMK
jgi:hypothetical protein